MSANEELEEQVHHAHEPFDKRVAGTMAIIAALLAIVTVVGQYLETEELLLQQRSSDQWAFYQAKSIRRFVSLTTKDTLAQMKADPAIVSKYEQESKRYQNEGEKIQEGAKDLESESHLRGRQSLRVHFGEVFLEIAIVVSSLSILTKRRPLFTLGAISGIAGIIVALTAYFVV